MKEEIKKILQNRIDKAFSGIYNKFEKAQLNAAIEAIESLVPPEDFSSYISKDKVMEIIEIAYHNGANPYGTMLDDTKDFVKKRIRLMKDHECNDDGEPILMNSKGQIYYQRDYTKPTQEEAEKFNATMGTCTCSICGIYSFNRDYLKALKGEL